MISQKCMDFYLLESVFHKLFRLWYISAINIYILKWMKHYLLHSVLQMKKKKTKQMGSLFQASGFLTPQESSLVIRLGRQWFFSGCCLSLGPQ